MSGSEFDVDLIVGENPRCVSFAERGVVFVKGDHGELAYLVRSGQVEIRGAGQAIEIVGPGGLFGEMALDRWRPAQRLGGCGQGHRTGRDRSGDFRAAVARGARFRHRSMRLMAARLRATNARAAAPGAASPAPVGPRRGLTRGCRAALSARRAQIPAYFPPPDRDCAPTGLCPSCACRSRFPP